MFEWRWYAGQALAGLESTAIHHLKREGITAWSPPKENSRPGRLYPGYVFIELADPNDAGVVNRTRGIRKLLPVHGSNPLPLPRGFVEELRGKVDAGAFDDGAHDKVIRKYLPTETVPIVAGPYSGFYGEMVRYHKGSLIVLLSLFGSIREIPIPEDCAAAMAA